jgi:hypothetical protein
LTRTVENLGSEIERRWAQLGAPPPNGELRVIDLPQTIGAGDLLLGVADDGSRLLVPLDTEAHRSFKPDMKSRGVHLLVRQVEQDAGYRWYLDVVCIRQELRWLFSSFVADVLLRLERQPESEPTAIIRACFSAWRALFAGGGPRMTIKQLAGLYGELHVLGRLLERSTTATERWTGPLENPHDFVSPGLDVEVKTTLSSEDEIVHIHGLDQLSAPAGVALRLAHLRVETPSPDGESLGQVVERLVATDTTGKLPVLLGAAGYGNAERQAYDELTFGLLTERWYTVDERFPRLSASTFPGEAVPEGLGNFRYTLDLAAVPVLPLASSEIEITLGILSQ